MRNARLVDIDLQNLLFLNNFVCCNALFCLYNFKIVCFDIKVYVVVFVAVVSMLFPEVLSVECR